MPWLQTSPTDLKQNWLWLTIYVLWVLNVNARMLKYNSRLCNTYCGYATFALPISSFEWLTLSLEYTKCIIPQKILSPSIRTWKEKTRLSRKKKKKVSGTSKMKAAYQGLYLSWPVSIFPIYLLVTWQDNYTIKTEKWINNCIELLNRDASLMFELTDFRWNTKVMVLQRRKLRLERVCPRYIDSYACQRHLGDWFKKNSQIWRGRFYFIWKMICNPVLILNKMLGYYSCMSKHMRWHFL